MAAGAARHLAARKKIGFQAGLRLTARPFHAFDLQADDEQKH